MQSNCIFNLTFFLPLSYNNGCLFYNTDCSFHIMFYVFFFAFPIAWTHQLLILLTEFASTYMLNEYFYVCSPQFELSAFRFGSFFQFQTWYYFIKTNKHVYVVCEVNRICRIQHLQYDMFSFSFCFYMYWHSKSNLIWNCWYCSMIELMFVYIRLPIAFLKRKTFFTIHFWNCHIFFFHENDGSTLTTFTIVMFKVILKIFSFPYSSKYVKKCIWTQ